MDPIYTEENEKYIELNEIKREKLFDKKKYLKYLIIFISNILIICLIIFLIVVLKGKKLNDEKQYSLKSFAADKKCLIWDNDKNICLNCI